MGISMNNLAKLAMSFKGKDVPIKHIPGPEGVRGRNSENTLIKKVLGWEPSMKLEDGLKKTFDWIVSKIEEDKKAGIDTSVYSSSKVVVQSTESLDKLNK